jgi:hypothetical protein
MGAAWLLLALLMPLSVKAQSLTPEPPGPYVIDIRGTTLGVPQTPDFYPADLPGDTIIPARGFGLQAGAHLYRGKLGPGRFGFGVDFSWTRGTAAPVVSSSGSTGTITGITLPDVHVTMRVISPQVSWNFGSSKGWSYLTGGGGVASVRSVAGAQDLTRQVGDINAGAGARWFLTDHLGVGFDLRAHWIGGVALFGASAGFSLK